MEKYINDKKYLIHSCDENGYFYVVKDDLLVNRIYSDWVIKLTKEEILFQMDLGTYFNTFSHYRKDSNQSNTYSIVSFTIGDKKENLTKMSKKDMEDFNELFFVDKMIEFNKYKILNNVDIKIEWSGIGKYNKYLGKLKLNTLEFNYAINRTFGSKSYFIPTEEGFEERELLVFEINVRKDDWEEFKKVEFSNRSGIIYRDQNKELTRNLHSTTIDNSMDICTKISKIVLRYENFLILQ